MAAPIVFFDIAGPDGQALRAFYTEVFGWTFDESGQCNASVTGPLVGAIRVRGPGS